MPRLARVAGASMAPTYRPTDLVLLRPVGRPPRVGRGDVVVFRHDGWRMLKRVVAVAGDVVELDAGRLAVNGSAVDGRPRVPGALTRRWHVPPGTCFMAGDATAVSDDSRIWADPFVALTDVEQVVLGRVGLPRLRSRRRGAGARPGR